VHYSYLISVCVFDKAWWQHKRKERPFPLKKTWMGCWQTCWDSYFLGETTSIISINSEYNSQKTMPLKKIQISVKDIELLFEQVSTLWILCKNFHSVWHMILICIMILYIFSFWKLSVVKMFMHCLVVYLHYTLSIPIKGFCISCNLHFFHNLYHFHQSPKKCKYGVSLHIEW
jgi:hypothetical protein